MQKGLDSKGVYRQGAANIVYPKAYWLPFTVLHKMQTLTNFVYRRELAEFTDFIFLRTLSSILPIPFILEWSSLST